MLLHGNEGNPPETKIRPAERVTVTLMFVATARPPFTSVNPATGSEGVGKLTGFSSSALTTRCAAVPGGRAVLSTAENPCELLTRMSAEPSPFTSIALIWPELGPAANP